ncbi:MAG: sulfate permease [Rhodothermales bacterium]
MTRWLPGYNRTSFRNDLLAGLTVGVVLVPQSMAYALLAGVPPVYGLYASLVPLLVYPIFGTSKQLAGGVIAIDMLIVAAGLVGMAEAGSEHYIQLAILLAVMAGTIQIVMGLAGLGFVVNLLSRPIITGFASAAALIIAFSQVGSLAGVTLIHTSQFQVLLPAIVSSLGEIHPLTLLVGTSTIATLLLVKRYLRRVPGPLLVAVLGALAAWFFDLEAKGLRIVGDIRAGIPMPALPAIHLDEVGDLFVVAVTLALVQFMSVVTLGKVFAAKHKYSIRPNRELVAMGLSNFVGSFFHSIPVSGSFSRTAVNDQAGARTPMANVFAAALVALTLLFFTPLVRLLPIPVLSAIIIVAALGLFDVATMKHLWSVKRIDGAISIVTFVVTLFVGIEQGILTGIAISVIAIMYRISRPNVAELGQIPGSRSFRDIENNPDARIFRGILILRIDASFSFANAEFLKELLDSRTRADASIKDVVIDASSINDLDTTAAAALGMAAEFLAARGVRLHFGGVKSSIEKMMSGCGLVSQIGSDHFFMSPFRAVESILRERGQYDDYFGPDSVELVLPAEGAGSQPETGRG